MTSDPLKPSLSLLVKLGSIAVHADEMNAYGFDQTRHGYGHDRAALVTLLEDSDVVDWCAAMTKMAMLPEKR